ncbi:DUF2059 domain-containing protein [Magnetococcus sp. PR-3]|uniref:DUF2059 domain-containing protein n=1 Tax=Magnetococcus sp. PR-3 TaxID=3120355 RepID=UPI002FCE1751
MRICLFALMTLTFASPVWADDLGRRLELAQDVVILRDTGGLVKKVVKKRNSAYLKSQKRVQRDLLARNPKLKPKVAKALAKKYAQILKEEELGSAPEVEKRAAAIYAKEYSRGELKQIKRFFSSSVGRKFMLLNSQHLDKAILGSFAGAKKRANKRFVALQKRLIEKARRNKRPTTQTQEYEM